MAIEEEVKLVFSDAAAARQAVRATGARLVVPRRLLDDTLFDTSDDRLRQAGTALRLRRDGASGVLTWKGPARAGPVKAREEIETTVGTPSACEALLRALGYRPRFRGQKYREEYTLDGAAVVIDETPLGVFVEIEAEPAAIARVATALGRSPADYRLESYPTLWRQHCMEQRRPFGDMLFDAGT